MMMDALIFIVVIVAVAVVVWIVRNTSIEQIKQYNQHNQSQIDQNQALQQHMNTMMQHMYQRMDALNGGLNTRLDTTLGQQTKVFHDMHHQLGALGESIKTVQGLGQEVGTLTSLLKAPKLRGNLGEMLLEDVLRQILPHDLVTMQYRFEGVGKGSAQVVDAVIHLADRLVPIDAKFPLESFQRLLNANNDEERTAARKEFLGVVRKHMGSIAQKYIRPEQGTYDFALMYMPAENLYYEAVIRSDDTTADILEESSKSKVIPVSPNTLYAYLLTVAYGLKGMQIEKKAETIRADVALFQRRLAQFMVTFEKMGKQLDLAYRHHEAGAKELRKLDMASSKITGELSITDDALEKAATEEHTA